MKSTRADKGYKVRVYVDRQLQRDFGKGETKHPYATREGAEKRMEQLKRRFRKVRSAKYSIVCCK
jgi:hypothetical protein